MGTTAGAILMAIEECRSPEKSMQQMIIEYCTSAKLGCSSSSGSELIGGHLCYSYPTTEIMNPHFYPCLHCHPHSYIRMVQHLIERCLLLHMSRDQCVKTLAEHASIRPLVTHTVWRELQKENKHFFQAYFHAISPRPLMSRSYIQRPSKLARTRRWN